MEELKKQLCFNIKNSIIHTVDTEDQCYVMDISVTPTLLAAAGSNFLIKVYDRSNNSIVNILNGHSDRINEIRFIENTNTLLSCSEDKSLRIWDCKTGQQLQIINQQGEIYSFDLNNDILAMGVGNIVVLYNLTSKKLIRKFEEGHTQDVTRVRFHPMDKNKLISCSVDGLICIYDLEQQDDDDVIIQVINAEDSIGEIGFFGDQYQYLYSLSHTEKLTLWDLTSGNKIKHFNDIRTILSERYGYPINYLVTCLYDKPSNQLILFAGNFEGTGYVFLVTNDDVIEISKLPSIHTDVIRNVYWDKFKSELITSAEDSKIAFWISSNSSVLSNSSNNKMVEEKEKPRRKASPY